WPLRPGSAVRAAHPAHAADHHAYQASPVEAGRVPVLTLDAVEVAELEVGVAHHPVIGDQDPRDRTQRAAVEAEPGEDVHVRVGDQPPGGDHDPQDTGDQAARAEADQFG